MKEIKQLLKITKKLKEKYGRNFTLDGRLVGDIGEVLTAEKYGLELLPENTPLYDAFIIENNKKKKVQIKCSFKGNFQFPYDDVPKYYLCSIINEDGSLEEVFNGKGQYIVDNYITPRKLKGYKNSYYTLSKGVLKALNKNTDNIDKIEDLSK